MPKPERQPKDRKKPTEEEEKRLRALSPTVGNYLDFVLPSRSGIERHHFLRELFVWAERLTPALFLSVVERALRYGITDLATIERIARLLLRQGGEMPLPGAEVDESFQDREAYQQGRLTDRSEEHTSELQSHSDLVCRLLLEKKKKQEHNRSGRSDK